MKKAQSMPISLVVVGIILIVTMIIVLFIFNKGAGTFQKGSQDCVQQGGLILDSKSCADSGGRPAVFLSAPEGKVCCIGGA